MLSYGSYLGRPVTKVALTPLTGRRHQLRLHSLLVGHPIVGDATYGGDVDAPRMCLHAWRLRADLARLATLPKRVFRRNAFGGDAGGSSGGGSGEGDALEAELEATARDPFTHGAPLMETLVLDEGAAAPPL